LGLRRQREKPGGPGFIGGANAATRTVRIIVQTERKIV